jgi:hypothetical protein
VIRTTREQRKALKRMYDRIEQTDAFAGILTYRKFRKTVQPTFGCDGAIAVPWHSMWLCIEKDGYTHS